MSWYPPGEKSITVSHSSLMRWSLTNNEEVNGSISDDASDYSITSRQSNPRIDYFDESNESDNGG